MESQADLWRYRDWLYQLLRQLDKNNYWYCSLVLIQPERHSGTDWPTGRPPGSDCHAVSLQACQCQSPGHGGAVNTSVVGGPRYVHHLVTEVTQERGGHLCWLKLPRGVILGNSHHLAQGTYGYLVGSSRKTRGDQSAILHVTLPGCVNISWSHIVF